MICMFEFIAAIILIFMADRLYALIASPDFIGLQRWVERLWQWGMESFLYFSILIVSLLSIFFYEEKTVAAIIVGLYLQLAGTALSIHSLFYMASKEKAKPIRDWWNKRPSYRITTQYLKDKVKFQQEFSGKVSDSPSLYYDNNELPLEERLTNIISNQKRIADFTTQTHVIADKTQDRVNEVEDRVKEIKDELSQSDKKIELHLIEWHLADFIPTIGGLVWIVAGMIISTIGSLLQ